MHLSNFDLFHTYAEKTVCLMIKDKEISILSLIINKKWDVISESSVFPFSMAYKRTLRFNSNASSNIFFIFRAKDFFALNTIF